MRCFFVKKGIVEIVRLIRGGVRIGWEMFMLGFFL